jgi:DNA-binding NtrC family response regulator
MVKILYINGEPATRDALRVAMDQFKGFEGEFVELHEALPTLKGGQFHVIFLEDQPDPVAALECLEAMSAEETRLPAILIADETNIKSLLPEKKRLNIGAFLRKPLDPIEVFRLLARLRDRIDAVDLTTE